MTVAVTFTDNGDGTWSATGLTDNGDGTWTGSDPGLTVADGVWTWTASSGSTRDLTLTASMAAPTMTAALADPTMVGTLNGPRLAAERTQP